MATPKAQKSVLFQVIAITVAIHAVALVAFGSFTVYRFISPPEPEFEPPPPLERIEPQKLEYKVRSKDLQRDSARPRQQRISVQSVSEINTPDINVALPEFNAQVAVGAGTGFGAGLGQGLGSGALGFGQSAVNFFGVESRGERIIFVFDISTTVVNNMRAAGMPITQVRDKMIELIEELNPGTLFGIIQHSRNFDVFLPELIPAIPENKEKAIRWLRSEFRTDGSGRGWRREDPNGIQSVMRAAFAMEPDLLFVMSDASYYRTIGTTGGERVPWGELERDVRELQRELERPAAMNFIGFGVRPDDANGIRHIVRQNRGQYREFQP